MERVGWGWRGCSGWQGEAYFEILGERRKKKQDERVGIDVMEADGIKRR